MNAVDLTRLTPFDDEEPEELRARIVRLLRSELILTREERDQLADLFDVDAPSLHVAQLGKRKGRPKKSTSRDRVRQYEIARFVRWRVEDGAKKEAAIAEACAIFEMSRASVFKAMADVEKRLAADREARQHQSNSPKK